MAINFGNSEIDKIFFGSSQIDKVYKGSQLIYELSAPGNTLYSWGYNSGYILGLGHNTSPVKYATLVTFPNNLSGEISDVFASSQGFAVINGDIYGWGSNVTTPTLIADGGNWKHVRNYANDKYALNQNGELYHWTDSYSNRTQFSTITNWDSLYGGYGAFFGVTTDGKVYAWGRNGDNWLLGIGSGTYNYVATSPILILTNSSGIKKISMSSQGVALITNDGKLYTWGTQSSYELGYTKYAGNTLYRPTRLGTLSDWTDISLIQRRCYGLRNGQIYIWGSTHNTSSISTYTPTLLSTIIPDVNNLNNNISSITAGGRAIVNTGNAVLFAKRENSLITYGLYNSNYPLLGFYNYSISDLKVVNSTLKFDKIYFYGNSAFATTITG